MTTNHLTRYVRYSLGGAISYGILDGDCIREIEGTLFGIPVRITGNTHLVSDVQLLIPVDPSQVSKVIGVTGNHDAPDDPQVVPHPRWFAKLPSSLNPHEGDVELPPGAGNLNYEGELVAVIGKEGRHISLADAPNHVFGVAVGNDWSENTWYPERQGNEEPSRLVAKSLDTWACLGTTIVAGLDYSDLAMEIRLNNEVVAKGRTKYLRNNVAQLVSYLSSFATLVPGDLIYTGTVRPPSLPGARKAMEPGDVVEVEIEDIGVLRNRIIAATAGPFEWPDINGRRHS